MNSTATRTVVFAYHNVGVRGLSVLLANNVDVGLVVTHEDSPEENIWFNSVAELARLNDISVITPKDPNTDEVIAQIRSYQPQWFFSFYYRHMLGQTLLSIPTRGAYNLHGSLLPKYRGRVPINWAIINGEQETGASLHRMEIKPDAGPLLDQQAVPILPNDTAHDVFLKVTCASEMVLQRVIPELLAGTAQETALDLKQGAYYGGRTEADGCIDWNSDAVDIHNLIRAVAPPYPGAFCFINNKRLNILGSYYRAEKARSKNVCIYWQFGACWLDCKDGKRIRLTRLFADNIELDEVNFSRIFGSSNLTIF